MNEASPRETLASHFEDFDRTDDSSHVSAALDIVETLSRHTSSDSDRGEALQAWIDFLTALDRRIDRDWDPDKVPPARVPPPDDHGAVFPSGEIDPATIAEETQRASYVSRLEEARRARARYTAQDALRQIGLQAVTAFADFVENNGLREDLDSRTATSGSDSARIGTAARGQLPAGW